VARIGRYDLLREIARGGMGTVYEAEDTALKRRVALKVLREDAQGDVPVARLHREAEIAAQLKHPNIVAIHEVGTDRDSLGRAVHFIAMDFVEGGTLADVLTDPRRPRLDKARMLEEVARAVAFAHSKGVIHRDLKPANVLVDDAGRVLLTDFGLAREALSNERLTRSQAVLGTPHYMAPEQAAGRTQDVDARTDVYALGVMLYEMLTGGTPFEGATPAEVYQRVIFEEPRRPSTTGRSVERDLEVVCLKAMEKERGRRYGSAADFADDLMRWRRGEPILARPPSLLHRMRRRLARRRGVIAAAVLVVVAVVAVGAALRGKERRIAEVEAERRRRDALEPMARAIREARAMFYIKDIDIAAHLDRIRRTAAQIEAMPDKRAEEHALIGAGWYWLGDLERAEAALQRAPDDGWASFLLGRICMERALTALLTYETDVIPEWAAAARDWSARALAHFRRPAKTWSGADEIDRHLAQAYMGFAGADTEGALRLCEEGLRKYGGALGSEEYWILGGWIGPKPQALAAYERAIEKRPHYPLGLLVRGIERQRRGDRRGALEDYSAAIRLNPLMGRAYDNRGDMLVLEGRKAEALLDFNTALRLDPGDVVALQNRGSLRKDAGDLDGAMRDYDETLRLAPTLAAAWSNRATVWMKKSDYAAALRDCDEALRLKPAFFQGRLNRAIARRELGELKEALADAESAIELEPGKADGWLVRGHVRFEAKEMEGAVEDYTQAEKLAPERAAVYSHRGMAYMVLARRQEAVADFTRAVQLDPNDAISYANRGAMRAELGDPKGAASDFTRALDLAPPDWPHRGPTQKNLERVRRMVKE